MRNVESFRDGDKRAAQIVALAAEKRKPVGTLVREWIMERLEQERKGGLSRVGELIALYEATSQEAKAAERLEDLEKRVAQLEACLDGLNLPESSH